MNDAATDTGPTGHRRSPNLAVRPVPRPDAIPAKRCPNGHPNDLEARTCRLCPQPMDPAAEVVDLVPGSLGRLLLEDGSAVELTDDLLIGRCPPDDPTVETLTTPGRQVSRLHVLVEVRGWRLLIRDLGSTNGTFVTRRGERGRRRVPEDRSIGLRVGDTIHFGGRQALVTPAAS